MGAPQSHLSAARVPAWTAAMRLPALIRYAEETPDRMSSTYDYINAVNSPSATQLKGSTRTRPPDVTAGAGHGASQLTRAVLMTLAASSPASLTGGNKHAETSESTEA